MKMRCLLLLILTTGILAAQTSAFDVISVRPCQPGTAPGDLDFSHGRITVNCLPLKTMIAIAYGTFSGGRWNGFPLSHVEGGPSWTDVDPSFSNSYTVITRGDGSASEELTRGAMLRAILEDRFQLRLRRVTRQSIVYSLITDPRGSKLRSFNGSCTLQDVPIEKAPEAPFAKPLCSNTLSRNGNRRTIDMPGTTVSTFASALSRFAQAGGDLDGPISDHTGLSGFFDVHLQFGSDDPDATLPGLARALQEQLGLRLEKTTGPDDFLIIEHVERPGGN
jgi:uncharacterized protein (TIGR03435 family)